MEKYNPKKDYKPVQSIERIFQILEILAKNPEGLSLMALSEKTGLPNSTVHRLLHTLYSLGYTEWRYLNSAPYKLTLRLFEYGNASVGNRTFVQKARPFLDRLSEELNLPVYLALPDQADTICILNSSRSSFIGSPIEGSRLPMWCNACGKCILSSYQQEEVLRLWENRNTSFYGPNAPSSLQELLKNLDFIHQHGYIFCNEEYQIGLATLGVPLIHHNGTAIGALCVCGAPSTFSLSCIEHCSETLKQYSKSLISAWDN